MLDNYCLVHVTSHHILRAVDIGNLAVLALLDISAAFETVDHATLLRHLDLGYGIGGRALTWFTSYLGGRCQFVRCGASKSTMKCVLFRVPQGSIFGPILFLHNTADLLRLIKQHGLHAHLYADDTQIYGACAPPAMYASAAATDRCMCRWCSTFDAQQPTAAEHSQN
jgi:Reverse transcriptase (RNA-dependent DNA polymerase)